jgi:uncharacterized membrane protein
MKGKATALGHSIHPMVIVFPLGLFATAAIFDLLYLFTDEADYPVAAAYVIAAGIIGGVVAAATGWIDWFSIPSGTRAKRIGLIHGVGNAVVLLLFVANWLLRMNQPQWQPGGLAITLSIVAVLGALFTGWLGGELVERLGVSVDEGANLDAASSLSAHGENRARRV